MTGLVISLVGVLVCVAAFIGGYLIVQEIDR